MNFIGIPKEKHEYVDLLIKMKESNKNGYEYGKEMISVLKSYTSGKINYLQLSNQSKTIMDKYPNPDAEGNEIVNDIALLLIKYPNLKAELDQLDISSNYKGIL